MSKIKQLEEFNLSRELATYLKDTSSLLEGFIYSDNILLLFKNFTLTRNKQYIDELSKFIDDENNLNSYQILDLHSSDYISLSKLLVHLNSIQMTISDFLSTGDKEWIYLLSTIISNEDKISSTKLLNLHFSNYSCRLLELCMLSSFNISDLKDIFAIAYIENDKIKTIVTNILSSQI